MQKNWIGKSHGCEIDFKIKNDQNINSIKCFTTRPDTLFGLSFLALSIDWRTPGEAGLPPTLDLQMANGKS